MPRTNLIPALALMAQALNACSESNSPLPTAPPADMAASRTPGNPQGFPPDGWVFLPAKLGPGFTKFECTFAFPSSIDPLGGPHAACQEKQWGNSGIFREQIRDLDIVGLPPEVCAEGVGHIDEIRICSLAWIDQPITTPWGDPGPNGCRPVVPVNLLCGA